MKIKKKFVTIKPKSPEAEDMFEYSMLRLQSCELLEITPEMYHLKPIKANCTFWMKLKNDDHWEIDK